MTWVPRALPLDPNVLDVADLRKVEEDREEDMRGQILEDEYYQRYVMELEDDQED